MKKQRFHKFSPTNLMVCIFLALASFLWASGDEALIQKALFDAAERGGVVHLAAGAYHLTRPIVIPDGVELRGESEASVALVAPQDTTFPAIILRNVSNVGLSRLRLIEQDHRYKAKAPAVAIDENCRFISIREVATYGFSAGFSVGRNDAGTVRNVVFETCRAEASTYFGFELNNGSGITLENCYSFNHRLDGIKLRKQTRDITVIGGESSNNGASDQRVNGNGIDGYAGADSASVYDMVAEGNNGSGFYFKSGPLSYRQFGAVGNLFFCGIRTRNNRGSGIDINRSGGDTIKENQTQLPPMSSHVVVVGGVSERNRSSGYYVRSRKVALFGSLALENVRHGIDLASAWDVTVVAPTVVLPLPANDDEMRYGVQIGVDPIKGTARRVTVINGQVRTALPVAQGPLALAAWHIGPESRHIFIDRLTEHLPGPATDLLAPEAALTTRILSVIPSTTLP